MEEAEEIDFASGIQSFESKHFSRAMQLLSPLAEKGYADGIAFDQIDKAPEEKERKQSHRKQSHRHNLF